MKLVCHLSPTFLSQFKLRIHILKVLKALIPYPVDGDTEYPIEIDINEFVVNDAARWLHGASTGY